MRIILASGSPRRRALLDQIGLCYEAITPQTDEVWDERLSPEENVASISRKKAEAARRQTGDDGALFIAADTMVFIGGERLGKPRDEADAYRMLTRLSGQTHYVRTALTLSRGGRMETAVETTAVTFRTITEQEKRAYIRTGDAMDKAGAYGVQGKAALFVTGIEGDYFNVMGLPVQRLGQMLADFGVEVLTEEEAE